MNLNIWKNEMCELKWSLTYEKLIAPIKMLNELMTTMKMKWKIWKILVNIFLWLNIDNNET